MKRSMLSLALALILSLAACSGGTPSETQIPAAETTPAQAEATTGSSSHYPVTITSYDYAGSADHGPLQLPDALPPDAFF